MSRRSPRLRCNFRYTQLSIARTITTCRTPSSLCVYATAASTCAARFRRVGSSAVGGGGARPERSVLRCTCFLPGENRSPVAFTALMMPRRYSSTSTAEARGCRAPYGLPQRCRMHEHAAQHGPAVAAPPPDTHATRPHVEHEPGATVTEAWQHTAIGRTSACCRVAARWLR